MASPVVGRILRRGVSPHPLVDFSKFVLALQDRNTYKESFIGNERF
jgi:hypothetical protein